MRVLFLLFVVLPLLEVYILFKLGRTFGAAVPVLAVVVSALAGLAVARTAGLRVLGEWRRALAQGVPPDQGVIAGLLVLLACALLIMPGLVSDVLGIALLIPPLRRAVGHQVTRSVVQAMQRGTLHVAAAPARASRPSVIDVEGEVIEPSRAVDNTKQLKP